MVTSLSSKGFLQKKQSDKDKRSFILIPTDKAIQLVEETYQDYFTMISTLHKKMGEKNFSELVRLLEDANHILLEEKRNG
ncbi:hypothetical protein [Listeria floridensis]|uniref:hypothetical protein n=1 Tax=Listeria floridensis TaxID=1494962 RepID=UPI003B983F7F